MVFRITLRAATDPRTVGRWPPPSEPVVLACCAIGIGMPLSAVTIHAEWLPWLCHRLSALHLTPKNLRPDTARFARLAHLAAVGLRQARIGSRSLENTLAGPELPSK